MAGPIIPSTARSIATPRKRPALSLPSGVWLVLSATAVELLYVLVLRLDNWKEHVEAFIVLAFLLGILYFVSICLAERIVALQ